MSQVILVERSDYSVFAIGLHLIPIEDGADETVRLPRKEVSRLVEPLHPQ